MRRPQTLLATLLVLLVPMGCQTKGEAHVNRPDAADAVFEVDSEDTPIAQDTLGTDEDLAADLEDVLDAAAADSDLDGTTDLAPDADGPTCACGGPNVPFGVHHTRYQPGTILPDHVGPSELDQRTRDAYDAWKSAYLVAGCTEGQMLVDAEISGLATVSEAHGYGMLIAALMAGHDPDAQTIFDELVAYYHSHPSSVDPALMAWAQDTSCQDSKGVDSATDGDLDIAFALLLADRQWGSCGAIDYRSEALHIIGAIRDHDVAPSAQWPLLGDWVGGSSARFRASTRPSDHMTGHFATFAELTGNTDWNTLAEGCYDILETVQEQDSPTTGLVPDFIEDADTGPRPASDLLEGANDGLYAYNACRVPWRIGTAFLVHGHGRAKDVVERMTAFMRTETGDDPSAIRAVYRLDGTFEGNYSTMAFIAPFGVAAMVDSAHQSWLNAIWDTVVAYPSEGYYEDSIKLLSMMVMSGNWWSPALLPCP